MIRRLLPKSEFSRHALTLTIGTTIAQAIPIAISPILTRLFTPADFGVFALFGALAAFLGAAATGRYELAVMLPESEDDADSLVILSVLVAAALGLVMLLAVLVWRDDIARLLGHPEISSWLFIVPVSVVLTGTYSALNYWLNRRKGYRQMSMNRVLQTGISGTLQIGGGTAGWGAGGLIVGQFVAQLFTTSQLVVGFWNTRRTAPRANLLAKTPELAARYRHHPLHLLPALWIGVAALQVPVFAVASIFGAASTGLFSLANRVVLLPTQLIANALGDVYRQRASVAYRERGEFRGLFLKTLGYSAALAAPPLLVIFAVAPDLFSWLFGEPWRVAGEYARTLTVAAFFQFVFTPVDKGALIVGATGYIALWHVVRFTALLGAALASYFLHRTIGEFLALYVVASSAAYVLEGWMEFRFSSQR